MPMSSQQRYRWRPLGLLALLTVTACTGVPAPGPMFRPSATPPPAEDEVPPDLLLQGALVSRDGATASITTRLWQEPALIQDVDGIGTVKVQIRGDVTVRNVSPKPSTSLTTVYVDYLLGFTLDSKACTALEAHSRTSANDKFCWLGVAQANPFVYDDDAAPQTLGGEEHQSAEVTNRASQPVWETADSNAEQLAAELAAPAVVVAVAHTIGGQDAAADFQHTCELETSAPTTSDQPKHVPQGRVIVGSSASIQCADLPQ